MTKYIYIRVFYTGRGGNKILQRGVFPVNTTNFNKNELEEKVRVSKNFINQIRKEMGGEIKLEKVLCEDEDITNYCK